MKIAILTSFSEFIPGYSLTGIVKDQITMLHKHGEEVHIFVNENYNDKNHPYTPPEGVTIHKKTPFTHLKDYRSINDITEEHQKIIQDMEIMLKEELKDFDFAFTHDFVFTGWNLPYGEGCKRAGRALPKLKWLHWIHSVPSIGSDWWNIKSYGPNHKLIFPNETDRLRVAEQYRGTIEDVRSIPHIKDLRTWFDFHEDTCRFIDKYPGIMQSEVVQVLPASVDRLSAKRVKEVMSIFGEIKSKGNSVFLLIANQWSTGRQQKDNVEKYRQHAIMRGLIDQIDFAFTSDFESPKFDVGIPKVMVRELLLCSNLFIFPTREESFGLVVPEASLTGGVLLVLNKSLHMQIEISGSTALYFDFGSFSHDVNIVDPNRLWRDIATIILGRMRENESIRSRTFMRRTYNMDNLYHKYYASIMGELSYR